MKLRIIAILLATLPIAVAQDISDPETKLEAFRQAFEDAMETRSAPARKNFADALEELARKRAQAGDYDGAIRARDRRAELVASAPTADEITPSANEITIDLASGSRTGSGLKYDNTEKKLTGFSKLKQSIQWDLNKTTPGAYKVLVTYSCGNTDESSGSTVATGGSFTLAEATNLSTNTSPPLTRTVTNTGGWSKKVTHDIGEIDLTGSRTTLKLTVTKVADGGLMHLYAIRLVPAASTPGTEDAENTPKELASLKAKFRSAINSKTQPLVQSYGIALRDLGKKMTGTSKLENLMKVQQEYRRAEKLATDPTLIFESPEAP